MLLVHSAWPTPTCCLTRDIFLDFSLYSTCYCWSLLTSVSYKLYTDVFQVRLTNLQPSGVTFPQDSIYQKLLKSVHVWWSYSKNKKVAVFLGHSVYGFYVYIRHFTTLLLVNRITGLFSLFGLLLGCLRSLCYFYGYFQFWSTLFNRIHQKKTK